MMHTRHEHCANHAAKYDRSAVSQTASDCKQNLHFLAVCAMLGSVWCHSARISVCTCTLQSGILASNYNSYQSAAVQQISGAGVMPGPRCEGCTTSFAAACLAVCSFFTIIEILHLFLQHIIWQVLLEHGSVDCTCSNFAVTLLVLVCMTGESYHHREMAVMFWRIDCACIQGKTALHLCAAQGALSSVEALLADGAAIDCKDTSFLVSSILHHWAHAMQC